VPFYTPGYKKTITLLVFENNVQHMMQRPGFRQYDKKSLINSEMQNTVPLQLHQQQPWVLNQSSFRYLQETSFWTPPPHPCKKITQYIATSVITSWTGEIKLNVNRQNLCHFTQKLCCYASSLSNTWSNKTSDTAKRTTYYLQPATCGLQANKKPLHHRPDTQVIISRKDDMNRGKKF